jgi:uncharacterized protein (TIGR02598 family)
MPNLRQYLCQTSRYLPMRKSLFRRSAKAFSLVEVVIALGLSSFVLVALVGLLGTGLQTGRDSEDQIQATNLASLLTSTRMASPTNDISGFALSASVMTNAYQDIYGGQPTYVAANGKLTNAAHASYQITCYAGTNLMTGRDVCQVYIKLSWPALMKTTNIAVKNYELLTYIPVR